MRMRTIDAAHAALLADDPGCELTRTALRRLVISGRVPSVRIGDSRNGKYLVDVDQLETNLFRPAEPTPALPGTLRRIDR